jgi:hypothetical protein
MTGWYRIVFRDVCCAFVCFSYWCHFCHGGIGVGANVVLFYSWTVNTYTCHNHFGRLYSIRFYETLYWCLGAGWKEFCQALEGIIRDR